MAKMRDEDVLMITADHGCDPGYLKTTDHTREYTPFVMYGKPVAPGNLGNALDELLSLHGIYLTHSGKMLRCKGRNTFVLKFLFRHAQGIADGENTRVEYADNVARICLVQNLPLVRHNLPGNLIRGRTGVVS